MVKQKSSQKLDTMMRCSKAFLEDLKKDKRFGDSYEDVINRRHEESKLTPKEKKILAEASYEKHI